MNMAKIAEGDRVALQHSVYTALISMNIALYNIEYIQSQAENIKGDRFMNYKKQDRFKNMVREFRSELLTSINDTERRQTLIDSLDNERIEALNSIIMTIAQLPNTEDIEAMEDIIVNAFKK